MEDLDDATLEELKAKAIERDGSDGDSVTNDIDDSLKDHDAPIVPEVEDKPVKQEKKPKRQRSEKQKAAFEKARQKRAENLKIKKQIEAEKKQKQKEEKEQIKKEVQQRVTLSKKDPSIQVPVRVDDRHASPETRTRYREQVVNNYYYYGTDFQPPTHHVTNPAIHYQPAHYPVDPVQPKKSRKKKVKSPPPPPEPEPEYSSEEDYSDPEEPESFKELQNYTEEVERSLPPKQNNGLKFRFA